MDEDVLAAIGERPDGWMQRQPSRGDPSLALDQWAQYFDYGGLTYPFWPRQTLVGQREEWPDFTFEGFIQGIYKANGVVFACMLCRMLLFSEARFQFRQLRNGRPGDLFGTPDLDILEKPWKNATTGDLLSRAIQDADLAGNFFATRRKGQVRRMRPDWVTIVAGSPTDPDASGYALDAEVLGYIYQPGGPQSGYEPETLLAEEVCHFAPIPDPIYRFRGMSWLTPVIREILGDSAATSHKLKFFENGATVNMVVSLDASIQKEAFDNWVTKFERGHRGALNAYKTLYLGGGATATPVGTSFQQMEFKVTQGAGETRIAAASGVPAVIVGLSEGLAAATYSNYAQARRRLADGTMRPLWRNMAGSMATLVPPPPSSELWYDDRDISWLREDRKDASEIAHNEAATIRTLVDAGYRPETVVAAVQNGDWGRLQHTGLYSVQLQPPGTVFQPNSVPGLPPPATKPKPNGTKPDGKEAPAVPAKA
jgi:phage portal protein BeeE